MFTMHFTTIEHYYVSRKHTVQKTEHELILSQAMGRKFGQNVTFSFPCDGFSKKPTRFTVSVNIMYVRNSIDVKDADGNF